MLKPAFLFLLLAINQVQSIGRGITSNEASDFFQLDVETYRGDPRNIMIAISLGGSSHTKWVLEIGQVLSKRGHNVTYITRPDQVHLADAFDNISAVSVGEPVYRRDNIGDLGRDLSFYQIIRYVRKSLNNEYASEMHYYQNSLEKLPDFFICDAFDDPCIDFAVESKIPFAITCTGVLHQDMHVPYMNSLGTTEHATSEHMTLWERFHHKYIEKINVLFHTYTELKRLDTLRTEFGLAPVGLNRFKQWDKAIKLVNTYFGFMPAQATSPLTHLVGPIISTQQKSLSAEEKTYLDAHHQVVYVACGQITIWDKIAIEAIMSALLDQLSQGRVDGIIWTGLAQHVSFYEESQPDIEWHLKIGPCVTSIRAPLLQHDLVKAIFTPAWASQFSVLAHPSTTLFVFQGGAESTNEATFNGVPLFILPYYGDTRIVARRMQLAGVARVQERHQVSFESVQKHINDILLDVNGTIAYNVARMKTLARMGARRKSIAADLIEEHMYTSKDGVAEHRNEPSRNMSLVKAMDIDLHATVIFFIILTVYNVYSVIRLF